MLWGVDIIGIMISSIGAFIGFIGVVIGVCALWENNKTTKRVENVEKKMNLSECWEELNSRGWKRWLRRLKLQAVRDGLIYTEIEQSRRRKVTKYILHEDGRRLLNGLVEKINEYIDEDPSMDIRTLILDRLGRECLLKQAEEKKVEDIKSLIAVIAAYFD